MGGAVALSRAAEIFPTRPITLVVPWLAGGPTDSICRALATAASKILGQPIVIVNKPGVEGTMGAATVARQSNADGYTLANMHTTVLRSSHMRNLGFDPLRELTYIIGFTSFTPGVVVRADAPWKTWAELLLFAKANPGQVTYSSLGPGSTLTLAMEEVGRVTGVKFLEVPYKGTADSTTGLLSGQTMLQVDTGVPMVLNGRARMLAFWGEQRNPMFKDVPTFRELGVNIVAQAPQGIVGPGGMSPLIVKTLHDAFLKGMDDAQFKKISALNATEPWYRSSADYRAWAVEASANEARLVKLYGLEQR